MFSDLHFNRNPMIYYWDLLWPVCLDLIKPDNIVYQKALE
jgi:hypothetical protein